MIPGIGVIDVRLPLCVRIDAKDQRSAEALKKDGWREIEILLTWQGRVIQNIDSRVKLGEPLHFPTTHSRLYKDEKIPRKLADKWRKLWIETAAIEGECLTIGEEAFVIHRHGRIDFIGVHPTARRKGLAKALIHHIGGLITAGTQAKNFEACAFYEDRGLKIVKAERTFHKT